MRKICIYFPVLKAASGPQTFMKNLKVELDTLGFKYQQRALLARGMFFPVAMDLKQIKKVKFFKGKIIQRLDGVFYPSKHSDKYKEHNKDMKNIYQNYADHVVFQSEYSKKQVFEMFGEKKDSEYSLICNGANTDIYYPAKNKKLHKKIRFITTGNFRNKDMLEPVLTALDKLEAKGVSFELNIFGPISLENKEQILSKKYVKNGQSLDQNKIADALRKSDIFIYSHLNAPCPNSVIEAVSCALPVVGFDSGALKEICHFNADLFAYVSEETFQKYEDFDSERLLEKIELAIDSFDKYKKQSLAYCNEYSMIECAKKYIEVFNKV